MPEPPFEDLPQHHVDHNSRGYDKISEMPFPAHEFDDKVAAWIERLANAML